MLSVRNLTKTYSLGKKKNSKKIVALDNVSVDFPDRGLVFLLGKSGSGKSTLLNSIGGLDTFDSGEIIIKGKSSKDFTQSDFDSYRNTFIGFIFQEYNILQEFSVGKNLAIALELQGKNADKEEVEQLLEQVDLKGYYKRKPNQLSGGQKQRVAIARALIKDPEIIMADEPTGALDSATGKQVMDTLKKLSETKLVIIVSHDREFAEIYGDRVIELKDGKIIKDDTKVVKMAQKTESGVSFIDNKIIHIKKGQNVTHSDLLKINKLIIENCDKEDILISLDDNTNDTVKKASFITDEGNRETFISTTPQYIQRKQHDPKNFKLIKSKLKMGDAFKMGVSSLKHKPFKLIFTILLSCIAFCLFGLVDTLASFNQAKSLYESMKMLEVKTVGYVKEQIEERGNSQELMNDDDISKIKSINNNFVDINPVIYANKPLQITNASLSFNNNYNSNAINDSTTISGIMKIDENIRGNYNLNLIEGDLPTTEKEICISSNLFDVIKDNSKVKSFEELKQNSAQIDMLYDLKIVGVLKDDTNIQKYKEMEIGENNIADYAKLEEIRQVIQYGLVNMCYVTPEYFETLSDGYQNDNIHYNLIAGLTDYGYSSSYSFDAITPQDVIDRYYLENYLDYIKPGVSVENLDKHQVIVDSRIVSFLNVDIDDIQSKINEGWTIRLYKGYGPFSKDNYAVELTVVGYTRQGLPAISSALFKELYNGYDYAIMRLNDINQSEELIHSIANYESDDKCIYSLQFSATPIFNSFGGMIEGMSEPFLYVGIGFAVFAGFMLMNFIATSISYKKREIGVFRAIGARGKDVFSMFFSESFVICVINFILACIGCGIASYFINKTVVVDLGFSITLLTFGIRQIVLLFAVSFFVALISSFFPVYKIARKNPIDSINNR